MLQEALQRLRLRVHAKLAQRLGLAVDIAWLEERVRALDDRSLWEAIDAQGSGALPKSLAAMIRWWRRVTRGM